MSTTMLAIPRSDCGEDWSPSDFRRGSAFSVSTLECKQETQYILQPYHLYPRTSPALACTRDIIPLKIACAGCTLDRYWMSLQHKYQSL
jgi:hypothetical protein